MKFTDISAALLRHRVEDERGLRYTWPPQLAQQMSLLIAAQPALHVSDPYQAFHDAFSTALHTATPVQLDAQDFTLPGPHNWDGRPLWLEFPGGRTYGDVDYEGALIFATTIRDLEVVLGVLMGQTVEKPLAAMFQGKVQQVLPRLSPGGPLRDLLCAVTHIPMDALPTPRHEPLETLDERLGRLVRRVTTLAPGASASLPELFLKERHTWSSGVFVPSPLTCMKLAKRDGLETAAAAALSTQVSLLTAWRFSKDVVRIDEGVLADLRRAGPPERLPAELPGLSSYAVYIPLPGGLIYERETGLFVGLDELRGQRRLLMLIETRAYGDVHLRPVSLTLGTDLWTELEALAHEPLSPLTVAEVPAFHEWLGLALQCVLHIGDPAVAWREPGRPRWLQPVRGRAGKPELREAQTLRIWNVGPQT